MSSDFKELLSLLKKWNVRFLLIGGHAVMRYTEPRYTKDLDIWIDSTPTNSKRVYQALLEFGAPLGETAVLDFCRPGMMFHMGHPPSRVDIVTSISGLRFAEAWPNRRSVNFDGLRLNVMSPEDLIKNKRAAGRPQDLIDAANLETAAKLALKKRGRKPS